MAEWFRAVDLKSEGPLFKSSSSALSGFVLGSPEVNSSTALDTEIAKWSASHQLEVLEFSMLYDLFATLVYFIYCVPS